MNRGLWRVVLSVLVTSCIVVVCAEVSPGDEEGPGADDRGGGEGRLQLMKRCDQVMCDIPFCVSFSPEYEGFFSLSPRWTMRRVRSGDEAERLCLCAVGFGFSGVDNTLGC